MPFNQSNHSLSRMGLGLAALGRPGYINLGHSQDLDEDYDQAKMEAQTHLMLDKAYELGVRYFDAAQSYGKAESFLSSWLRLRSPTDVIVGSKWGYYYTAGWSVNAEKHEIKEHTLERLQLQWPESKDRLDPWLKLYQIHSATFESGVLENQDVLRRLFEIKKSGYAIGLSVSGEKQADIINAALKIGFEEEKLFDTVQVTYNILEQSTEAILKKASDAGVKVIVKEGVANGRLTGRNNQADYYHDLKKIAEKHKVGVDSIALAFILSKPFVDMVLSGVAVEAHLVSNLKAAFVSLESSDIEVLNGLQMNPESYWNQRSKLKWN